MQTTFIFPRKKREAHDIKQETRRVSHPETKEKPYCDVDHRTCPNYDESGNSRVEHRAEETKSAMTIFLAMNPPKPACPPTSQIPSEQRPFPSSSPPDARVTQQPGTNTAWLFPPSGLVPLPRYFLPPGRRRRRGAGNASTFPSHVVVRRLWYGGGVEGAWWLSVCPFLWNRRSRAVLC